ncbi:MAG: WYL domain-containing protein [Crocinitomicaceae bacterium]|nr:WYL domain-containing protein [Crocinitomicaceae bacterium]
MPHIKNALIRYRIIDRCLKNKYKPFPTKQDLRQACEDALFGSTVGEHICDSTIEKDMFAMKMEHDAPIKYSKREKGYYYEDPEFSINDVPLNEDDLESIRFAAETLFQFKDVQMFRQFGSTLDKIINKVSVSQNFSEEEESIIQFESAPSVSGQEYINALLNAIKFKNIVEFEYQNFKGGKKKKRRVVGYLLKEYRNRWYLISYDLSKEAVITYGLDRMDQVEVLDETYLGAPNFNAKKFFKHAMGITSGDQEPVEVLFKADAVAAKYINSQPLHSSQKLIKEGKNRATFSIIVYESEELYRTFLSYAGQIEVTKPKEVREEMIRRANELIKNYEE